MKMINRCPEMFPKIMIVAEESCVQVEIDQRKILLFIRVYEALGLLANIYTINHSQSAA